MPIESCYPDEMIIRKALIATDTGLLRCDVIEHADGFWLVPEWLDNPSTGETRPARIICLDLLRHDRQPGVDPEFVVNEPIPISVLDGRAPAGSMLGFLVVDLPEITLKGGVGLN